MTRSSDRLQAAGWRIVQGISESSPARRLTFPATSGHEAASKHGEPSFVHQSTQSDAGVVAATAGVMEQIILKPIRQSKASLVVRLDPLQELARAVLAQAVADACNLTIDERERLAAAAFLLNGAEALGFWCAVGGLDPRIVRRYSRQLLDHPQGFELLPT